MTARHRWTAIAFALAALACGDIASPLRSDLYEWRVFAPSATGIDTISFHWPADRLPVRVWVEDASDLPTAIAQAITTWRGEFLYREFDATVVSDSTGADVIVHSGPPTGPKLSLLRLHSALAPQCSGETDVDISDDHQDLRLPIRIFVDPKSEPGTPGLAECVALTSMHEFGHSLGIFEHSPTPTDLMFADPTVSQPSERDRNTAEVLYHLPSTVQIVDPNSF
jgi:predicted Zn-dependent protease